MPCRHHVIAGYRLFTHDAARYLTYFPRLGLIALQTPGA